MFEIVGRKCTAICYATVVEDEAVEQIRGSARQVSLSRKTKETDITLSLDLDGRGTSHIDSGIKFFAPIFHYRIQATSFMGFSPRIT